MKPFDAYEISPCARHEEPHRPGHFYYDVCEPHEADVWTLYGHVTGEGVYAIGDFDSREQAEEIYRRITGSPFTHEATAHIKAMHTGPKLLAALLALKTANGAKNFEGWHESFAEAIAQANEAITEATGGAA